MRWRRQAPGPRPGVASILRERWVRVLSAAVLLLGAGTAAGLRVNVTRSLPLGLYRIDTHAAAVRHGSIVIVCLDREWTRFALERGILGPGSTCPGGSYGLGKLVVGTAGDVVEIRPEGLWINGRPVPQSRTLGRDSRGRALPHYPWGTHRLAAGQVWLFSPYNPAAFDSRYFGPVTTTSVTGVVQCVPGLSQRCR